MTNSHFDDPLKYSLWLIPDTNSSAPIQAAIDNLAIKYASLPFAPHMTICSQLSGSIEDLESTLFDFAKANKPLQLRGLMFSHRAIFYQSLFIQLETSNDLKKFHNSALEVLQHHQATDFFPHVSLAYIDPETFDARSEITHLDKALLQTRRYDQLALMETSGEQKNWTKALEITLHDN